MQPPSPTGNYITFAGLYRGLSNNPFLGKSSRRLRSDSGRFLLFDFRAYLYKHKIVLRPAERFESHRRVGSTTGWDGTIKEISTRSRMRLMERVAALDAAGIKPTHMLTITWLGDWENTSEYVSKFRSARTSFLERLRKKLKHEYGDDWGYLWVLEFQRRGAPHLHILLVLPERAYSEWDKLLSYFIRVWINQLAKVGIDTTAHCGQSVDFGRMRRRGWNYVVKYVTKMYQKRPPFPARWGNWYGYAGRKIIEALSNEEVRRAYKSMEFVLLYRSSFEEEVAREICEEIRKELNSVPYLLLFATVVEAIRKYRKREVYVFSEG